MATFNRGTRFMPHIEKKSVSRRGFLQVTSIATAAAVSTKGYGFSLWTKTYPSEHRDHIIIGSGFGGSITAFRLAEQGIASMIIEQGRRWDQKLAPGKTRFSKNLYPDGRSTWLSHKTVIPLGPALPIPKSTGVLQGRKLAGKMVLNGAAYGGGSIVYGGCLVKPTEAVYNLVYPSDVPYSEISPYYDRAFTKLKGSNIPEDIFNEEPFRHVRVAKEQAEKAGVEWDWVASGTDWDIVRDEISGKIDPSLIHGEAIYGVNSGGKTTMDQTYLKDAEATGLLEVRTLYQVQDIGFDTTVSLYTVSVNELNVDGDVIAKRSFTCKKLFLTAGTVSSTSLLVKAKAKGTLPELNTEIGQGWGNNGNNYGLRLFVGEKTGKWQGGPPSIAMKDFSDPENPVFLEHPQLPVGIEISGLLYGGIGINRTRGTFVWNENNKEVEILYPENDPGQEKINEGLVKILDKLNDANGGITSSLLTYLKGPVKSDMCYHPMGGVVMGRAADFYGRVKGYEGLYVNDGSFLPGSSAGTNPSLTISAFAERNMDKILAEDF